MIPAIVGVPRVDLSKSGFFEQLRETPMIEHAVVNVVGMVLPAHQLTPNRLDVLAGSVIDFYQLIEIGNGNPQNAAILEHASHLRQNVLEIVILNVFQDVTHIDQVHRPALKVRQRSDIVRDDVHVGQRPGVNVNETRDIFLPATDVDQYLAVAVFRQRRLDQPSLEVGELALEFSSQFFQHGPANLDKEN